MILSALALSYVLSPAADAQPVLLNRTFTKGEKLQYAVTSSLQVETREYGSGTFIPFDYGFNYRFTTETKAMKADGIAVLKYSRPTVTQLDGETFQSPAKTKIEKVNDNLELIVSPINEIIGMKDLNPPKKPAKKPAAKPGDGEVDYRWYAKDGAVTQQNPLAAFMDQFVTSLYQLCLGIGSFDSGMDFSPKLPFDEVKAGDTWQKTVGYQPQKMTGKGGKTAVKRLDYTYTYKGIVTVNGKQYHRVTASLDLNTDFAAYIHDTYKVNAGITGIKTVPLNLKQSIDYNLDLKTKRTVSATAEAKGGYHIVITSQTAPIHEERMTGSTQMYIVK